LKSRFIYLLAVAAVAFQILMSSYVPVMAAGPYPLANASVSASPAGFGIGGSSSTDASGNYVINSSIGIGAYNVTASSPGFVDLTQSTMINALTDVNTLNFNLNRSAIVWGYVVGFDGKPVIGAMVTLWDSTPSSTGLTAVTDSSGKYLFFDGVDSGTYFVKVDFSFSFDLQAEGLLFYSNFSGLTSSLPYMDAPYMSVGYVAGSSSQMSVTAGGVAQIPTLTLSQSGVISGGVTDGLGHALAGVGVSARGASTGYTRYAITDSQGNYRISYDVTSDNYTVSAGAPGYVVSRGSVVITGSGTGTVNIATPRSATIQGHLTRTSDHMPLPGAFVEVSSQDSLYNGFASTDASGSYNITSGLATDNYSITVILGTSPFANGGAFLTSGQATTQDFSGDAFILSGIVYANSTGGPRIGFASIQASVSPPIVFPFGMSTNSSGVYFSAFGVPTGLRGTPLTFNITASALNYNPSSVVLSINLGADINQNFVLTYNSTSGTGASAVIRGSVTGNSGPELPASFFWWHGANGATNFLVGVNSTSIVPLIFTDPANDSISLFAEGPEGTHGTTTVFLPDSQFRGPFAVTATPGPNPTISSQSDNGTYSIVTLTYNHSYHYITLKGSSPVPEFPGLMVVAALGSAVAVALLFERRVRLSGLSVAA
jgi:hypothetical protein